MTHLDTLNLNDIYLEVADLARRQGVLNASMWNELAEEVLESHLDLAELDKDQELPAFREKLYDMWDEYKRTSQIESAHAIDEDPEKPHD